MRRIVVSLLSLLITILLVSVSLLGTSASELEQELITSVGDVNEDPKFDLNIDAPETYRAGDDIIVTVSVVNIESGTAIDYLDFTFNYDNTKLLLTNDIDEANQGVLDCIDMDALGGQWEQFTIVNSNYNDLTPDDLRGGAQAVPYNDGVINAAILTPIDYLDSIIEDNVIVFEFTFQALEDAFGDIGMYIPHNSVNAATNGDEMLFFHGNGGYEIITEDTSVPEESSEEESSVESSESSAISSDTSSDASSDEMSSNVSSEESNEESNEESSETSSDNTSSDDNSSDIVLNPELENELIGLIGTPNDNPMFDLVISAPERYNSGDEVVVTVSVRNIQTQYGIDYLKFMFYYDHNKLMLTNDIDESNQGALVCIDDKNLGSGWESFVIVNSNYNDLTPDDLRGGVQATPNNDGVIDVSLLTTVMYLDSIKDDDVIVFEFTFTAFEDAEGDFGIYIPHEGIKGALNEDYGLDFFTGNGGYAIVTYDASYVPEESSDEVSSDVSSDTSSEEISDDVSEDSSTESSDDVSSEETSDDSSDEVSSDASSDNISDDESSDTSSDDFSDESSDVSSDDVSSDNSSDDISSDESSDISSDTSSDNVSSDESSEDISSDVSSDDSSDDFSDISSEPEWEIPEISVYNYVFQIDSVNGITVGEDTIIFTSTDFYNANYAAWSTTIVLDRINDLVYSVSRIIDNPILDTNVNHLTWKDVANINLQNGQLALVVHSNGDRPEDENGVYPNWEARAVARALQIGDKLILDKVVLTDNGECINGTAMVKNASDTSPDPIPNHGTSGIIYKQSDDGTYCYIDGYIGDETEVTIPSVYMGLPITVISEEAFADTDITAIIIPESITKIDANAFNGCDSLVEVYCEVQSRPDTFDNFWLGNSSATVLWGYTYEVALEECEEWINIFNSLSREEYCEPEWNNLSEVLSIAQSDLANADTIFKLRPIIKSLEYAHLINPKIKEFADINYDKVIDVFDYLLLKRTCFGTYELNEVQYSRGNLDRNDVIDVFDYLLIKRIAFSTYVVE